MWSLLVVPYGGEFTLETIDALHEVAALELEDALRAGIAHFASGHGHPVAMTRRRQLEAINPDAFCPLDDICFQTGDKLETLLISYVKSNMLNTILPDFVRTASDKAADQFREKNYSQVVERLSPFESYVDGATLAKLKLSRKKVIENSNS